MAQTNLPPEAWHLIELVAEGIIGIITGLIVRHKEKKALKKKFEKEKALAQSDAYVRGKEDVILTYSTKAKDTSIKE